MSVKYKIDIIYFLNSLHINDFNNETLVRNSMKGLACVMKKQVLTLYSLPCEQSLLFLL
jgi:hypothetical protein